MDAARGRRERDRIIPLAAGVILLLLPLLAVVPPAGAGGGQTFTVTTTADENGTCDATCSLREALAAANANAGADTIEFDFPGAGPHTLTSGSQLPEITDTVTIDGYGDGATRNSNPTGGLNSQLNIVLNGADAGDNTSGLIIAPGAEDSIVKGLVVNGFDGTGIAVGAKRVKIEGNFVGTDGTGGVVVNADDITIGGTQPEQRNLISGNEGNGVTGVQIHADNVVVQGNLIGTDVGGTQDLGNGRGILLILASNALIGGAEAAATNAIAFNDERGVAVFGINDKGNRFLGNSIFHNGQQGIELGTDGVSANDNKDPDGGPNRLQNFPELTTATIVGGETTIQGKLNSTPNTTFTIQVFATPPGDGADEGKIFLGQRKVTTNKKGKVNFTFTTDGPINAGDNVTTTATNKQMKDTSEFSAAVVAA